MLLNTSKPIEGKSWVDNRSKPQWWWESWSRSGWSGPLPTECALLRPWRTGWYRGLVLPHWWALNLRWEWKEGKRCGFTKKSLWTFFYLEMFQYFQKKNKKILNTRQGKQWPYALGIFDFVISPLGFSTFFFSSSFFFLLFVFFFFFFWISASPVIIYSLIWKIENIPLKINSCSIFQIKMKLKRIIRSGNSDLFEPK